MTLTPETLKDLNRVLDYIIENEHNHYLETVENHDSVIATNHIYAIAQRVASAISGE